MSKLFYRFRNIDSLVGPRAELERQYVFFPPPSTLNDPMEGFRDVFWRGDGIAWKNLLRHYLKAVSRACELEALSRGRAPISWKAIAIIDPRLQAEIPAGERQHDFEIQRAFFTTEAEALVAALASRKTPLRREELGVLIRSIHYGTVALVRLCHAVDISQCDATQSSAPLGLLKQGFENATRSVAAAENLANSRPGSDDDLAELFATSHQTLVQMELIHRHNGAIPPNRPATDFVVSTFPEEYVDHLETLLFPDWATACFMDDCRDAALWAYYGDNHKGACLVFDGGSPSSPSLGLRRPIGHDDNGPIMGVVPQPFEEVRYVRRHPEVDFFRSIASLPTPVIAEKWYSDGAGGRSACAEELFDRPDEWRSRHWQSFQQGVTTKLKDWEREREFRLIVKGDGARFSDAKSRSLEYEFPALKGIVFGIKTSTEDKLSIARVIEAKCRAAGRADFQFFQAYFSQRSGCVEHFELRHMRFDLALLPATATNSMDIAGYRSKLKRLGEPTRKNLAELGSWVKQEALPWLWDELAGAVLDPKPKHPMARTNPARPKLTPMKDAEAVRHGLMTSIADRRTKATAAPYYRAQMTMLDAEASRYCIAIAGFLEQPSPFAAEAVVDTLHRSLHEFMNYGQVLLEDAGREVTDVPGYFGAWSRKEEHPFEVFKGSEKLIYGPYSGLAHRDSAPHIPVAVLRTAIELRLRHAFGIYNLVDPANPDDLSPIDMSRLFEAIQKRQNDIYFAVDLHDIWKIYRWSNFYLHAGRRDFPWVPGFLLQYLRPVFIDMTDGVDRKWSIDGGIRMSLAIWNATRAELEPINIPTGIGQRLRDAWATLFPKARTRVAELPRFEPAAAQCVFLDDAKHTSASAPATSSTDAPPSPGSPLEL